MSEMIHNSLVCRALRTAGQRIAQWWRQGALAGCGRFFKRSNEQSTALRLWLAFGQRPNLAAESHYARVMHAIHWFFVLLGTFLRNSLL